MDQSTRTRPAERGPEIEFRDIHSGWAPGNGVATGNERTEALSGLSLRLPAGEITVLLGDHESGKSLLSLHLLGEVEPDSGGVLVDGESLWEMPEQRRCEVHDSFGVLRGGTGIREGKIDPKASVRDNLAEQLGAAADQDPAAAVGDWLDSYELAEVADRLPDELDSAARRRLAVALALAGDPAVVIVDNPGDAFDVPHFEHLVKVINDWHRRTQSTMLLTVHSLEVARDLGQQVAVLRDGHVAAHGRAEDVLDGVVDDETFEERFGTALGGVAEADPQRLKHLHTGKNSRRGGSFIFGTPPATDSSPGGA